MFEVLKAKCLSLYGQESIYLKDNKFNRIETAWNGALRRCFQVPYTSHVNVVSGLAGIKRLRFLLYKRHFNFIHSLASCNPTTKFLFDNFKHDCSSYIGNNYWTSYYYISTYTSPDIDLLISQLQNLIDCIFNINVIPGFNKFEIRCMINYLCTF